MADDHGKGAGHGGGNDTDALLWVIVAIAVILLAVFGSGQLFGPSLTGAVIGPKISQVISFIFSG